jgi:hypothetical protein
LSGTSSTGATVTGNAQGSAMITATADSVSGTSSITVNNPPPPPPPPPPSGAPVPGPSSTILLDLRQSLQQVTTLDQAFNLFGQEDHTAPRTVQNGTGWSFTTNFDGQGTHALRADWAAYPQGDQGIRIVTYLPTPKPHEVYFQFKGYLGKNPADPDANGSDNTFPLYPQSNSVKRMLILRDGVGGSATDRIDYVWTRTDPSAARVQSDNLNWGFNSSPSIWAPNNYLGRAYTTTIYFKTSSANGVADAVYKIWIDGTLVLDAENVMLDGYAMDRWQFPDTAHNFPIPASEYYWDILVWRP